MREISETTINTVTTTSATATDTRNMPPARIASYDAPFLPSDRAPVSEEAARAFTAVMLSGMFVSGVARLFGVDADPAVMGAVAYFVALPWLRTLPAPIARASRG